MCRPWGYGFCAVLVWKQVWFSRKLRECTNVFMVSILFKWVRKKEKYANSKWILRNLFCCCSNLSNDDIISNLSNDLFWSQIGSRFGGPGGTLPPKLPNRISSPSSCILRTACLFDYQWNFFVCYGRKPGNHLLVTYPSLVWSRSEEELEMNKWIALDIPTLRMRFFTKI